MKFSERYLNFTDEGKTLFWLIVVDVLVFCALIPFFLLSNMGLPLGWLLGATVVLICYITMIKGTGFALSHADKENGRNKARAWTLVFALLRFVLMIGALVLSAFFTFKIEGNFINFFTCAAAYLPLILVAVVFTLAHKKKKKGEAPVVQNELEEGEESIDD